MSEKVILNPEVMEALGFSMVKSEGVRGGMCWRNDSMGGLTFYPDMNHACHTFKEAHTIVIRTVIEWHREDVAKKVTAGINRLIRESMER